MQFKAIANNFEAHRLWCFPVTGKRPLVAWKPFQHCAPNPTLLNYWCRRYPWAGGGIPTGGGANLLVVDTDSREAADWYLSRGSAPTWCVRTYKGFHFYYTWPARLDIRNSASKVGPGVDVRGEGGFIVAPGSTRFILCERRWELFEYRWCKGYSPTDLPRVAAPDWLCAELTKKPETSSYHIPSQPFTGRVLVTAREVFDEGINRLLNAKNGTRNQTLLVVANCFGGFIRTGRMNKDEVINSILAVADQWEGEPIAKSRDTLLRGIKHGEEHG